jgi:excinuclease ABC subunit A
MKNKEKRVFVTQDKQTKADNYIRVYGAREHNLKSIDVAIPKEKLTIITGPSGSGKSSLALDVLFTEGKRRYMESLSSYARQFLGIVKKPEFDHIDGLCPAIAIEQKTVGSNPRSTVGTITEIYDYLRLLYSRVGQVHCPDCGILIRAESPEKITAMLLDTFTGKTIMVAAPVAYQKKGEFVNELLELFKAGHYRFMIDGQRYRFHSVDEIKQLNLQKTRKHTIDLLIDQLDADREERARVQEAVETAFRLAKGTCKIIVGTAEYLYAGSRMCVQCAHSVPELEPRFFSFNSPIGACPECNGLGFFHEWPWKDDDAESWKARYPEFFADKYAEMKVCRVCMGKRLNKQALAVTVGDKNIFDLCELSIDKLLAFCTALQLPDTEQEIARGLIKEIIERLMFLENVGLSYLSLNRTAQTLSGGEGQRIRLATQIGSALSGVLYILDEPSIGLHQRDNARLITTLHHLRDQGNTVVVVEHDIDTMRHADYIIDMGPAAGVLGGHVVACGTPEELARNQQSLTGAYLGGERVIVRQHRLRTPSCFLTLEHAHKNNLKDITVNFPLGVLCGISGVSGSGKSTLIMQELVPAVTRAFTGAKAARRDGNESMEELKGASHLESMVVIDQSPIGRTPRSNPATYLGIFDDIRQLFASLPESNARGYKVGRFSFNVKAGRCFECDGEGMINVSMQFLPDVSMVCRACNGTRYNRETLQVTYRGKNIAQILDMTAYEALSFFGTYRQIQKRLQLMCDVGLDYIKLGQPSTTLSGGEAQRIKLVDELAKRGRNTLYILDEPTTGLHNCDIEKLLEVLNSLVDKGNSMIVIEHNIDLLTTVDYLIDLGPEGGDAGGMVVAQGTPEQVAREQRSYTGHYLKQALEERKKTQTVKRPTP